MITRMVTRHAGGESLYIYYFTSREDNLSLWVSTNKITPIFAMTVITIKSITIGTISCAIIHLQVIGPSLGQFIAGVINLC